MKLQAKVSQHMSSLPICDHLHLHLLHLCLCLETAARQNDGAALLQCISRLQPHASQLTASQRTSILAMVGSQHSRVVQEAVAGLLLDSMAAEGSLTAVLLAPAVLSQLALSAEQQLRAVNCCRQLLVALQLPDRSARWTECTQVGEVWE